MRDGLPRRLAAATVLVVASAALIATTPGPPTARLEASGDVGVAPDDPGEVEVRFSVAPPVNDRIVRLGVVALVQGSNDPRLNASALAVVDADPIGAGGLGTLHLDPGPCADGCEVVTTITVTWVGRAEPEVRTAWSAEVQVEYENNVPADDPVAASLVRTEEPIVPPRFAWPAFGALLAALAGVWLSRWEGRMAGVRLLLAAGIAVAPAISLVDTLTLVQRMAAFTSRIDLEGILWLAGAIALILGTAVGVWRAARGRDAVLRVVGWLAALAIGLAWVQVVSHMGAYRGHELAVFTFALALPCAAAIGGMPVRRPVAEPRRIGAALSGVIASQLLMASLSLFVAGALLFSFAASLLSPGARLPDLGGLAFGLVPILVAAGFVMGLWGWRRGSRGTLVAANVPVVLVMVLGAGWTLLASDSGILVPTPELRVFGVVAGIVALVGLFGVLLLPPPTADDQRQNQGGQSQQVPRVAHEGDGLQTGDGA